MIWPRMAVFERERDCLLEASKGVRVMDGPLLNGVIYLPLTTEQKRQNGINRWHEKYKKAPYGHCISGKPNTNGSFGVAYEFQKLVRIANADDNGMCACCSCDKSYHYSEMNGGHFIKRHKTAIVFDAQNVNPQCVRCNHYLSGNESKYREFMLKTYGQEAIDRLEDECRIWDQQQLKWGRYELAVMKYDFKQEIKRHEERIMVL